MEQGGRGHAHCFEEGKKQFMFGRPEFYVRVISFRALDSPESNYSHPKFVQCAHSVDF